MKINEIWDGSEEDDFDSYSGDYFSDEPMLRKAGKTKTNAPSSKFVNKQIDKKVWSKKGSGATGSVWEHMDDPNTVVKVIGGGGYSTINHGIRDGAIAFVHFCVDHGYRSKHFPIIHGINVDDPLIVQIRMEKLFPIGYTSVADELEALCEEVRYCKAYTVSIKEPDIQYAIRNLDNALDLYGLNKMNNGSGIAEATAMLQNFSGEYSGKHHGIKLVLDLHAGNWMQRADGTIVAMDPWFTPSPSAWSS